MQNTTNYNLKKPDYTDFADIQDINDNMDIIDQKLASPDGDARGEVVSFTDEDLDTGITSFPTFLSKIVSGMKIAKFFRDFKAGMQYVLHKGSLINNGTCNTAGEYALDAAYGKVLRDDIDSLNSSLSVYAKKSSASDNFITPYTNLKAYATSGNTLNFPEGLYRIFLSSKSTTADIRAVLKSASTGIWYIHSINGYGASNMVYLKGTYTVEIQQGASYVDIFMAYY